MVFEIKYYDDKTTVKWNHDEYLSNTWFEVEVDELIKLWEYWNGEYF